MSLQSAMEFLEEISRRPALLEDLRDASSYGDLATVAVRHGFSCTPEELDRVFRYECGLRLARGQR